MGNWSKWFCREMMNNINIKRLFFFALFLFFTFCCLIALLITFPFVFPFFVLLSFCYYYMIIRECWNNRKIILFFSLTNSSSNTHYTPISTLLIDFIHYNSPLYHYLVSLHWYYDRYFNWSQLWLVTNIIIDDSYIV